MPQVESRESTISFAWYVVRIPLEARIVPIVFFRDVINRRTVLDITPVYAGTENMCPADWKNCLVSHAQRSSAGHSKECVEPHYLALQNG